VSYTTHVYGRIHIEPPVTWGELREAGQVLDTTRGNGGGTIDYGQCRLLVQERDEDTDRGLLRVREGTDLVPWSDEGYRCDPDDLVVVLRRFMAAFGNLDLVRTYTGRLEGEGEEQGDCWRVWVNPQGAVQLSKAQLRWPGDDRSEALP
jgi:hypothetical protein